MSKFQLLTLPLVRARSYNAHAIMTAKSQRFSERNPTAFASSFKTPAARFKRAPSTGAAFSAIFPRVFASLLVALAPLFRAFRAPMTMVVIIPATEMATTEIPPRFLFSQRLKRSIEPCQVVVLGLFLHDAPGKLAFGTYVSSEA